MPFLAHFIFKILPAVRNALGKLEINGTFIGFSRPPSCENPRSAPGLLILTSY